MAVRIAGININEKKHISIALTSVYGIGPSIALKICKKLNIEGSKKICDLDNDELENVRLEVQKYDIEGDLRREKSINIKRLIEIGSYRGLRHRRRLPVRGQRTRTNARTLKGKRK